MKQIIVAIVGLVLGAGIVLVINHVTPNAQANPFPTPDFSGLNAAVRNIMLQDKCKGIRTKMGSDSTIVNSIGQSQYGKFNEVLAKLNDLINRAGSQGYNVNKLKQDANTLADKINDFHAKYDHAKTSMAISTIAGCTNNPQSDIDIMKSVASTARDDIRNARTLAASIKQYYRGTIKSDIYNVSQQRYVEQ